MNTSELAGKLAEARNVSKAETKAIVDAFLKELIAEAPTGAEISLPGFGKFKSNTHLNVKVEIRPVARKSR